VREVAACTIFLNTCVRLLRRLNITAFGCGANCRCGLARAFREIKRIFGIERRPKRLSFLEQSFQFGSIFNGRGCLIPIQILPQAGECCSDILHDLIIGPVLRECRGTRENSRDNDHG